MTDTKRQAALAYHAQPIPGKLSVEITKPTANARDLIQADAKVEGVAAALPSAAKSYYG